MTSRPISVFSRGAGATTSSPPSKGEQFVENGAFKMGRGAESLSKPTLLPR